MSSTRAQRPESFKGIDAFEKYHRLTWQPDYTRRKALVKYFYDLKARVRSLKKQQDEAVLKEFYQDKIDKAEMRLEDLQVNYAEHLI